ncbi:MAG: hypothetical protein IJZ46_00790 [Bacilli bacterium]|nr:hypothetical protein [Bacilli bacterium]
MAGNMFDENGLLKPEYGLTDSQKRAMNYIDNPISKDNRTDYGKGIYYKGADGREYATIDQVRAADKAYWDSQMIDTSKTDAMISYIGKDGREYHTTEALERANKAYFDYLNSSFNINDKNMSQEVFRVRQEEILLYIRERYGNYLDKLLEEYGYGSQETGKGPKR